MAVLSASNSLRETSFSAHCTCATGGHTYFTVFSHADEATTQRDFARFTARLLQYPLLLPDHVLYKLVHQPDPPVPRSVLRSEGCFVGAAVATGAATTPPTVKHPGAGQQHPLSSSVQRTVIFYKSAICHASPPRPALTKHLAGPSPVFHLPQQIKMILN